MQEVFMGNVLGANLGQVRAASRRPLHYFRHNYTELGQNQEGVDSTFQDRCLSKSESSVGLCTMVENSRCVVPGAGSASGVGGGPASERGVQWCEQSLRQRYESGHAGRADHHVRCAPHGYPLLCRALVTMTDC